MASAEGGSLASVPWDATDVSARSQARKIESHFASVIAYPGEPWELPGRGESYETCGKFGIKGCGELATSTVEKHDVKKFMRTCGRAECPICFEAWSTNEAYAAMERFHEAQKQGIAQLRELKHVIVSPPKECHSWEERKLVKYAYRLLKRVNAKGGICIFHPFRWRCDLCGRDEESCECDGDSPGSWYPSPHFHTITHGWIEGEEVARESKRTGWFVKNLGLRGNLYATLKYQLSHAGVWMQEPDPNVSLPIAKGRGGKKLSITWFGDMSYNKFHVKRQKFTESCSTCGGPMHEMHFDPGFDPPFEGMKISGIEAAKLGLARALQWTGDGLQ
jgi:hypothetical protein